MKDSSGIGNGSVQKKYAVYIGHDDRQPLAFNVMRYSVESNASKPIATGGLYLSQLPITREGATQFTYSRWLVPWLMGFEGIGIFCDEDMCVTGDIWELIRHATRLGDDWDVAVVRKHEKFEWSSVMVFNNQNCTKLTPDFIEDESNILMNFDWTEDRRIQEIPGEWNHLCGMQAPNMDAKLYHFTQGIPYWKECRGLPEDQFWFDAFENMGRSCEWIELHANTKHFRPVMGRYLAQYGIGFESH